MAIVCPTITAEDPHSYREQVARVEPFAQRIHIDLADGSFAPTKLINIAQIYWPEDKMADLHLMYVNPQEHLETIVSLQPNLVVIHAEAQGDLLGMLLKLQSFGIKSGISLLPNTEVEDKADLIGIVDHVLLFAGNLGYQGGEANMEAISKIPEILSHNPTAELGWDGGINSENAPLLLEQGVEVFNVGSYIQHSDEPAKAYETLSKLLAKQ